MRIRVPGLRGKFVAALLIAAALPLLLGLILLETVGYQRLLLERGKLHQMEAMTLTLAIEQSAKAEGKQFDTWVSAAPVIREFVIAKNREFAGRDPKAVNLETRQLDTAWESLAQNDPRLVAVRDNPASASLREYQVLHPEVAELLVTDLDGRLIAATGKSSDFDQADEEWWQRGKSLAPRAFWTDVLHFDKSSKVFSLDVVMPVHDGEVLAGVAKLSVDITSLFSELGFDGEAQGERWEIVLPDGRILASSKTGAVSLKDSVSPEALHTILQSGYQGTLVSESDGEKRMLGFRALGEKGRATGAYVVFSSRRDDIVAPLRRHLTWIAGGSALVVALCALAGFAFVHRKILQPLAALGQAARSISATAKLRQGEGGDEIAAHETRARAEADLEKIMAIHTGDEVEALAGDLAVMTSRVLRYHRELEAEVEAKTSVIREDLEMAREFQNALLPSSYPEVPPLDEVNAPLRLKFAHFYQPASTVGGDFFDLIELDENCAGVLIADVMGHGARSALVTAILRALVRNNTGAATDPGVFLAELNRHLHDVISRSGQTLFVTAFFLVLDTSKGEAAWAVAGHPSPLRVRRGSGKEPEPLWTDPPRQPALGLIPEVTYRTTRSPLRSGDVFLLYTDGIVEAENPAGELFGLERLAKCFDEALDGPMAAMPAKIVCDVSAYQRRAQYDDDVCLVAVEAGGGGVVPPRGT